MSQGAQAQVGGARQSSAQVDLVRAGTTFLFCHEQAVGPFASPDLDSERIWWHEAGVNQNLTFPVQPDPASPAGTRR